MLSCFQLFEDISSTFWWFHKADFILFSKLGDGWSKILECWFFAVCEISFFQMIFCHTSRNCCTELCLRTAAIASTTTDILNGTLYHCRQRKEALWTFHIYFTYFTFLLHFDVVFQTCPWKLAGNWRVANKAEGENPEVSDLFLWWCMNLIELVYLDTP